MVVELTAEQKEQIQKAVPGGTIISANRISGTPEISVVVRPVGAYLGQEKEVRIQPHLGRAVIAGGYFGPNEQIPRELAFKRSELEAKREREVKRGTITKAPITSKEVIGRARRMPGGATPENIREAALRDVEARKQEQQLQKEAQSAYQRSVFEIQRQKEIEKGVIKAKPLTAREVLEKARERQGGATGENIYREALSDYPTYQQQLQIESEEQMRYKDLSGAYKRQVEIERGLLKPGNIYERTKQLYTRAEKKASKVFTKNLPTYEDENNRISKVVAESKGQFIEFKDPVLNKRLRKVAEEVSIGSYEGAKKKPLKTGLMFATTILLEGAGSYIGKGLGLAKTELYLSFPKLIKLEKAFGYTGKGIAYGAGSYYVGLKSAEILSEQKGRRARKFGEILSTEVIPTASGAYSSYKIFSRIKQIGTEKLVMEDFVAPEVVSGEKKVPQFGGGIWGETRPKIAKERALKQIEQFKSIEYSPAKVYPDLFTGFYPHVTSEKWSTLQIQKGNSYLSGAYVSGRGSSVLFARFGGEQKEIKLFGGSIFNINKYPEAMFLKPKKLMYWEAYKLPGDPTKHHTAPWAFRDKILTKPRTKIIKSGGVTGKLTEFVEPPPFGAVLVPGAKPEVEGIILPYGQYLVKLYTAPQGLPLAFKAKGTGSIPKGSFLPIERYMLVTSTELKDLKSIGLSKSMIESVSPYNKEYLNKDTYYAFKPESLSLAAYKSNFTEQKYNQKLKESELYPRVTKEISVKYYPTKTKESKTPYYKSNFEETSRPYYSTKDKETNIRIYTPKITEKGIPYAPKKEKKSIIPKPYTPKIKEKSPQYYPIKEKQKSPPYYSKLLGSKIGGIPLKKRKVSTKIGRTFKYTPSLVAIGFNRKSFKQPSTLKFSGLEIRPIVTKRKKKKRGVF